MIDSSGTLEKLTSRSIKNVHRDSSDLQEQISVLICASASGYYYKPLVVFPGKKPRYKLNEEEKDYYDIRCSSSGLISKDYFLQWLKDFHSRMKDHVEFPIIIFLDGYTAHINIAVSIFCRNNDIILYCLPPNATTVIQPLDIDVFKLIKDNYNEALDKFFTKYNMQFPKRNFFMVFRTAWNNSNKEENIISGFKKSGLLPFNPNIIDTFNIIEEAKNSQQNSAIEIEKNTILRLVKLLNFFIII